MAEYLRSNLGAAERWRQLGSGNSVSTFQPRPPQAPKRAPPPRRTNSRSDVVNTPNAIK